MNIYHDFFTKPTQLGRVLTIHWIEYGGLPKKFINFLLNLNDNEISILLSLFRKFIQLERVEREMNSWIVG